MKQLILGLLLFFTTTTQGQVLKTSEWVSNNFVTKTSLGDSLNDVRSGLDESLIDSMLVMRALYFETKDSLEDHRRVIDSLTILTYEEKFSNNTVDINSTTTFTSYHTETVNVPIDAEYNLLVSYVWNHNNAGNDYEGRILVDGTQVGRLHKQEPKDVAGNTDATGSSQEYKTTDYIPIVLTAGPHIIELQHRSDAAGIISGTFASNFKISLK